MREGHYGNHIILLFLFITLGFGAFVTFISSRFSIGIPYSVTIFISGILLSVWANHNEYNDQFWGSLDLWAKIDPHLLLFIFLPALLFGDAMELNIRNWMRSLSSALVLAGPGSLIETFLIGVGIKTLVPYDWSWNICFTIGSILSATDPVSVIALLKEVGASPGLKTIITLEASLNDGVALVLFNWHFNSLLVSKNASYIGVSNIALYFVRVLLISPLIGLAVGLLTVLFMSYSNRRHKHEDILIQITMTLTCSYLSFYLAESVLEVSGIISCIFSGSMLALFGPVIILEHETMMGVWEGISWVGNTLIFMLAGIIIGNIKFSISALDIGMIFLVYLLTQLIRIVMVAFFYPYLQYAGYEMTIKEAAFVCWSGVRGAICIALALVVERSTLNGMTTLSVQDSNRIFLIIGGTAALTLLINGTASTIVLNALGLVERSKEEIEIVQIYARNRISQSINVTVKDINKSRRDKDILSNSFSLIKEVSISNLKYHMIDDSNTEQFKEISSLQATFLERSEINRNLLTRLRITFLEVVRSAYWKQMEEGTLWRNSRTAMSLLYSIDVGLDSSHTPGHQDWDALKSSLEKIDFSWLFYLITPIDLIIRQVASCYNYIFPNVSFVPTKLADLVSDYIEWNQDEFTIGVLTCFIAAHNYAQHKVPQYLGETESVDTPEEKLIVQESIDSVAEASALLDSLDEDVVKHHVVRQIANKLIHIQEDMVQHLQAEGILYPLDADLLSKEIEEHRKTFLEKVTLFYQQSVKSIHEIEL